jgi:hypothetical protein
MMNLAKHHFASLRDTLQHPTMHDFHALVAKYEMQRYSPVGWSFAAEVLVFELLLLAVELWFAPSLPFSSWVDSCLPFSSW